MCCKNLKLNFFVFAFFLFHLAGNAQILPPKLTCVKNDTLLWSLPNNTCGVFQSYVVYGGISPKGPFSILTTITNSLQTKYFHSHLNTETWYYFLQSRYNCPTQKSISSDTLSSRAPAIAPIKSASVENGKVIVSWFKSASPQVVGYIIYRTTSIGTVPVDTVFNATAYIDNDSRLNPAQVPETYFVVAMDACGSTSLFDQPHRTILLKGTQNSCQQTINLNWTRYQNWQKGIAKHEVWLSINGGKANLTKTLSARDTFYVHPNIDDKQNYCFYIKAIADSTGVEARTNELCLKSDVVQPIRNLTLQNVSVNEKNDVELTWTWDNNAELKSSTIRSGTSTTNLKDVFSVNIAVPLKFNNIITDTSAAPDKNRILYQIKTTDQCDSVKLSNYFSTIYLKAIPQSDYINLITWSKPSIQRGELISSALYRIVGNNESSLATFNPTDSLHTDKIDPNIPEEARACYYLIAQIKVKQTDGTFKTVLSHSNTICLEQFADLQLPNAFAPKGKNQEFKPLFVFAEGTNYEMLIYDRWGSLVFESKDIATGWNGKKDGKDMPSGVYAYYVRLQQSSGKMVEKKGTVLLFR